MVASVAQAQQNVIQLRFVKNSWRSSDTHTSWWFKRDLAALDALMSEDFTFIFMNGTVETKGDVVPPEQATDTPRRGRLEVQSLELEPERVTLRGNSGEVNGRLHIKATVGGRSLPDTMRVLSVFAKEKNDANWRLTARSITPVLAPPPQ